MAPEQGPDSKSACEKGKSNTASDEGSDSNNDNGRHDSPRQDAIGWIYLLRKEQLVEQCKKAGIPTTGFTVDHLRKKLSESLRTRQLRSSTENLLRELEEEIKSTENSVIVDEVVSLNVPKINTRNIPDLDIMTIVQKWNLQFSGESDLMEFLERFEELAECYRIPCDQLLPSLLGVLRGNALKWYRVKRGEIYTWEKFREEIQKFFLPKRYLAQIEQNFYNRRQNTRERAKDFILGMLTLARQHPLLRSQDHLDRIYDGLRSEYRFYIRRRDFTDLDELTALTDEFEALKREERPQTSHMIMGMEYRRADTCWRCKRTGHYRRACTFKPKLFSSNCGKNGTPSRSCRWHENHYRGRRQQPTNDNRFHIPIRVNGLDVKGLVDTGATQTYISQRIARYLGKIGIRAYGNNGVVQLADRTLETGLSLFNINVSYRGKSTPLESAEIPSLAEDVILGMDFLSACEIELRLNGEILSQTEEAQDSTGALNATTSREFLTEEQNIRLNEPSDVHRTRFEQTIGLGTVAKHEFVLKHPKPDKQRYLPRNPSFERRRTKPTPQKYHIKPKIIQPPKQHISPPEARPSIIENIQIMPPITSSNPPPLFYGRQIKVSQITHVNKAKAGNVTTHSSSNQQPTTQANNITPTKAESKKRKKEKVQIKEKSFAGIKIFCPKEYRYHQQFLLHRGSNPPVQVTVMSRTRARLRYKGFERLVEMENRGDRRHEKQNTENIN